jgi:ABC-type amino acid transport substrate-binding protein
MSEDRIEQALLQGPPDEPAYMAQLTPADLHEQIHVGRDAQGAFRFFAGMAETAAAAVLVLAIVGIVLIRSGAFEVGAKPPTRLAAIQARGVIRIAVRPDRPQVTTPAGARSGIDVDVATEIGQRLGLRVELVFTPVDEILTGRGAWDVGMPSSAVAPGRFASTAPVYYWPVRLILPAGATASTPSDLDATTICVVIGSGGEAWLDGRFDGVSATPVAAPPRPSAVHRLATDEACAAEVTAGRSAASITSSWSDADLAARPDLTQLGGPVLTEGRPVIAELGEGDPAGLIAAIDQVVAAMRSDGTVADFSRSRFGGLDLSQPTTP